MTDAETKRPEFRDVSVDELPDDNPLEFMSKEQKVIFQEDAAHLVNCFLLFMGSGQVMAHSDLVHAKAMRSKVGDCDGGTLCQAIPVHSVSRDLLEWNANTSAELTRMILLDGVRSAEWLEHKQHDLNTFEGRLSAFALLG